MAAEGLSKYDIEMLYDQFEEKHYFNQVLYPPELFELTPTEDYFSEKKKKKTCAHG